MAPLPELIEFRQQLLVDALATLTAYVSGAREQGTERVSKPPTTTPIKVEMTFAQSTLDQSTTRGCFMASACHEIGASRNPEAVQTMSGSWWHEIYTSRTGEDNLIRPSPIAQACRSRLDEHRDRAERHSERAS